MSSNQIRYIFNETGYTENISVDLTARTNNFEEMRAALDAYGLVLSIEERNKAVYVVKPLAE